MAYVKGWQRSTNNLTTNTFTGSVYATTDSTSAGTPNATVGNLLVAVFSLRNAGSYTFDAPPTGWVEVERLKTTVNTIVCHRIASGTAADNITMTWTGGSSRNWYGIIAEYSGINDIALLQNKASSATNADLATQLSVSLGASITTPSGTAISILICNNKTAPTGMTQLAGFTQNTVYDLEALGGDAPQSAFSSASGTGLKTNQWAWTDTATQNIHVLLTYGTTGSGTAPEDPWTFTNMTGALNATGLGGGPNTATTLTATASGEATVLGKTVTAAGTHTGRWFLKKSSGELVGDVQLSIDGGVTWPVTINKANLSTMDFVGFPIVGTTGTPRIGLKLTNAGNTGAPFDSIIVGNSELYIGVSDPQIFTGASYIFTGATPVTAQVTTEVRYGATITPDDTGAWTIVLPNSRAYPMTEGQGLVMTETLNELELDGVYSSIAGWGTVAGWQIAARVPSRDTSFNKMSVVSALPGTPDADTIYFVTGP